MIYLLEIDGHDSRTNSVITLRFGSRAFTTRPDDVPARATFRTRLVDPGNYERYLFGEGRTFGESDVGAGEIVLNNADGELDFMLDVALDGRSLRLFSIESETSRWAEREAVLIGTMEQASFNGRQVSIRLRDRLDLLETPILTKTYAGTTINGSMAIAEGNVDLKDTKQPQLWGAGFSIAPILVDQFDHIYHLGSNPIAVVTSVRDTGVPLTPTQNYPTLAALKAASLSAGQFATCLALAYIRTAVRPGVLTVDAAEGATAADRSAARIVRRMIGAAGAVVEADFAALHAANPAECGLWITPSEISTLASASTMLSSIGGWISADRFGAFRVGRLTLPSGEPEAVLTRNRMISRGEGFARLPTSDPGDGVPAWRVTVRYAKANVTFTETDLKGVNTNDPFRTFATLEYRQVVVEDPAVKVRHPKAAELVFTTCLLREADARAEAERLLAIYKTRRDLFRVVQPSESVAGIDPADVVTLKIDRYGLGAGKPMRVLGVVSTFKGNKTTLEVWG